ncbi:hypothetical protein RUM44_003652 [Polyplax serrata]|uniref:Uncharacterized protein n=1 Tax=Polyplax serrata TaxID=468196 RepID=A0ABR1AH26_POLSC
MADIHGQGLTNDDGDFNGLLRANEATGKFIFSDGRCPPLSITAARLGGMSSDCRNSRTEPREEAGRERPLVRR